MNQLINVPEAERTPEQAQAIRVHNQIRTHKDMIGLGLAGICQDLKTIRDQKLYMHFGYETLGEYTKAEHNIGERQAYNYIQALETYGMTYLSNSENAGIGITKLLKIASLDNEGREKLLEEHSAAELAEMSTGEVNALVAEIASLKEQLSFLQEQKETSEQLIIREYEEKMAVAKLSVNKTETVTNEEVDELIESARRVAREDALIEAEKENAEKLDELEKIAKDFKTQAQDAEAKAKVATQAEKTAKEEIQKLKDIEAEAGVLRKELDVATAKAKAAEAQIRASANPELARFKFMFANLQEDLSAILNQIDKLDDETKPKAMVFMKKLIEGVSLL